jgi:hypothetical protein
VRRYARHQPREATGNSRQTHIQRENIVSMLKSPNAENGKGIDQSQERNDHVQYTLNHREYEIHSIHRQRFDEAMCCSCWRDSDRSENIVGNRAMGDSQGNDCSPTCLVRFEAQTRNPTFSLSTTVSRDVLHSCQTSRLRYMVFDSQVSWILIRIGAQSILFSIPVSK